MRFLVALLVLVACAPEPEPELPPQDGVAVAVAAAGEVTWDLKVAPSTVCDLDQLRVVLVPDGWCGGYACLGWARQGEVPIAYVTESFQGRPLAHLALHEWLHAAGHCYGRWGGSYDSPEHYDGAVWAGFAWSRPGNVEQRAQALLDADGGWL